MSEKAVELYLNRVKENAANWPTPYVKRTDVGKFTLEMFSPFTLASLERKGEGPKDRVMIKNKVHYPINTFVNWLEGRIKAANKRRDERKRRSKKYRSQ